MAVTYSKQIKEIANHQQNRSNNCRHQSPPLMLLVFIAPTFFDLVYSSERIEKFRFGGGYIDYNPSPSLPFPYCPSFVVFLATSGPFSSIVWWIFAAVKLQQT